MVVTDSSFQGIVNCLIVPPRNILTYLLTNYITINTIKLCRL